MTLVDANNQQRPELFWLVIGPVLKSITVLKTWSVSMNAAREVSADEMSEWARMVWA
jgi:hypothetical protein